MNAVQKCKILNHLIEKNYQYHTEHMDSYKSIIVQEKPS